jgi:hypothetical protein
MYGSNYFSQLMVIIKHKFRVLEVDVVQVWLGFKAMI